MTLWILASEAAEKVRIGFAMLGALTFGCVLVIVGLAWMSLRWRRRMNRRPSSTSGPQVDPWQEAGRRAATIGSPEQGPTEAGSDS